MNGRLAQLDPSGLPSTTSLDPDPKPEGSDEWETKAAQLTPQRHYRGPGISIGSFAKLTQAERDEWNNFSNGRPAAWTIPSLAEYWANGRRTALQIADLIEMETGIRDVEMVVRYFELLQKLGLVAV